MNDPRFDDLLNRLLDDALAPGELDELARLVRDDPERRRLLQEHLQTAEWIAQSDDALRDGPRFVAATLARTEDDPFVAGVRSAIANDRRRKRYWPWAVALATSVVLAVGVAVWRPAGNPEFARIAALQGSVQWTGDGGRVNAYLAVGSALGGGTLESQSADSWAVLELRDGTSVTISGTSTVTVGDGEQKELHLKRGHMSARVAPQPPGMPMLIHTPTAKLEVLGTQLNVDADPAATVVRVNEGRVRATRLVDGSVAEVPAEHQIVASVDRAAEYRPRRRPEAVAAWRSELPKDAKYGQWQVEPGEPAGRLRANPFLVTCGRPKPLLIYAAVLGVSSGDAPPVQLKAGGLLRVRGRMDETGEVYIGFTAQYPNGGFAGKYLAARKIDGATAGAKGFEFVLPLGEFHPEEPKFPASPLGLTLVDCWCVTAEKDHGLSVDGIDLRSANP